MPHLTYCLTSWSQACKTTLKPIHSTYKQAMKVMDKKPLRHHHCSILEKHALLSWNNVIKFHYVNLVYKILHGLAPPPLTGFINQSSRFTRLVTTGSLLVPLRKSTFGLSAFSARVPQYWNSVPPHICNMETHSAFKHTLKLWLLENQVCDHG